MKFSHVTTVKVVGFTSKWFTITEFRLIEQSLFSRRSKEGIAMAPEQTKTYMQAFSSWQKMNPSTKIGRPPPNGKPGYNPDLIVMDLDKLRASASYKKFFNEAKLNQVVKNYMFHSSQETPTLGDMLNLMAVDVESLFMNLGMDY